ncbi:hypothetical protein NQ318_021608 [Aromia moschata]|uniref:MADF domain-containing protein n=1 Tax=Aromia moschata TaxID=1265417 RepID=A0AAV8YJT9_9CUCU|nr:hypothetical protein NQ318_021608 [Aromia moschata]
MHQPILLCLHYCIGTSTISPDLAPCDFFLFPKVKSALKGTRFESVEVVKAKATEVLNQLTEADFQHCFQQWKSHMERLMEWSEDKALQLINAYRQQNLLWDPRHKNHFEKNMKEDAWREISAEIGMSAEHCRKKMLSLLSGYRRERGQGEIQQRNCRTEK